MNQQSNFKRSLNQHYRQYTEFLNDLIIIKPTTQILLALPNLTMIIDLMLNLNQKSGFINIITLLGFKEMISRLLLTSQIIKILILTLLIIVLFLPAFGLIYIVIESYINQNQKQQIGKYKWNYQHSVIHRIIRLFTIIFQYTFLPIITSIAAKNVNSSESFLAGISLLLLILAPLAYFIGQYHCLEINWQDPQKKQSILMRINFPNNIIDTALIYGYIIAVNQTSGTLCFLLAVIIGFIRVITAYCFPCYDEHLERDYIYILVSTAVFSLGIFLSALSGQILIFQVFIIILMILLWKIKQNLDKNNYIRIQTHSNQLDLNKLRKILWKDGLFTYAFRQLIFLQRKSNSYRNDLIISILKQKCYLYQLQSRGGAKVVNSQDLMRFQQYFIQFLSNLLIIADKSVSIIKLLQNKEPKCQIFVNQVQDLVEYINKNKVIMSKIFQINQKSIQAHQLSQILYRVLYNDYQFLKTLQQKANYQISSSLQKQAKHKLFNKKSSVIFINILDDVGKITKASKNLPTILGYSPHNLLGLSINQIIPFSIKPFHDQHLIQFVQDYSKKMRKRDPKINFYAYNKDFNLKHVIVTYYFIMSYFRNFQLSGVFKLIDSKEQVILTDYFGNLQGWTKDIGEIFCFNDLQTNECRLYNILPLLPAFIKYMSSDSICCKTLFFKTAKLKQPNLILMDFQKQQKDQQEIWDKQYNSFLKLIVSDQFVQAYLVQISMDTVIFCSGKVKMRKFLISSSQRIQNFQEIQEIIQKTLIKKKQQQNQSKGQQSSKNIISSDLSNAQIQQSDTSMISSSRVQDNQSKVNDISTQENQLSLCFDSNFNRDNRKENFFPLNTVKIIKIPEKNNMNISNNQILQLDDNDSQSKIDDNLNNLSSHNRPQASFQPIIKKNQNNTIIILIILSSCFFSILIYNQINNMNVQKIVQEQCDKIIKRNRAMMIFSKSVFNPNMTYVSEFDHGAMIQNVEWLSQEKYSFYTYLGQVFQEDKLYLFNVQIPSTLDRVAMFEGDQRKKFYVEIQKNFENIIKAYNQRLNIQQKLWISNINQVRTYSILRQSIIGFGSIIYTVFLIYMYVYYRSKKKNIQAFFKFQKTDLQDKITQIYQSIQLIQLKINQWHLNKQLYQMIKLNQITNINFKNHSNVFQQKIKFDMSQQQQQKISLQKLYVVLGFIFIFLFTQIIFIASYAVLNANQFNLYKQIPISLNKACKLLVLPNLEIASLFLPTPVNLIDQYLGNVEQVLQKPTQSLPKLFPLLQQTPCANCTFLYPILTTNFRSYYSVFQQIILTKKTTKSKDIKQLYLSVDVVMNRIMSALTIQTLPSIWPITFVYLFSLTVFFVSISLGIKKMNQQNTKLQVFLKYFNQEVLTKNKHMNSLLNKNI